MSASEIIKFVNEDCEFTCQGDKARWLLPNRTEIAQDNLKFQLQNDEHLSKLLIRKVNANDIGAYRCVSEKVDEIFNLKVYCKRLKFVQLNLKVTKYSLRSTRNRPECKNRDNQGKRRSFVPLQDKWNSERNFKMVF